MEALKNNSQAIVRALTVAVAVILQAITMVLVGRYLHEYASWAYVLLEIISFLLVFGLINDQESYRQFWCVIVLVFPVTGLFLYYMWGRRRRNSKTHIMIRDTEAKMGVCTASAGSHGRTAGASSLQSPDCAISGERRV